MSGYNLPRLLPEHGFNLAQALVGSESTLVTVLEAKLKLVQPARPDARRRRVWLVYEAADDVPAVMESGCIACEGMDDSLVKDVRARGIEPGALQLLPPGGGFLLVSSGASGGV